MGQKEGHLPDTSITAVAASGRESSPASYERNLAAIMAFEGPLTHINLDTMVVVTSIIGRMAQLEAMKPVLESKLKDFEGSVIDTLDDYTRALQHAHGLYIQATKSPTALQSLLDQATKQREILHNDAVALATRGLLNPDSFKQVRTNNGHRALILDLQVLVATFRERWESVKDRTAVRPEELEAAVALIDTLTEAVGIKDASPAVQEQATTIRNKAFALVLRTYDEVRAAVGYARRAEGDADSIAPSLYVGRSNGSSAKPTDKPASEAKPDGEGAANPTNTTAQPSPVGLTASLNASGAFKRPGEEG